MNIISKNRLSQKSFVSRFRFRCWRSVFCASEIVLPKKKNLSPTCGQVQYKNCGMKNFNVKKTVAIVNESLKKIQACTRTEMV